MSRRRARRRNPLARSDRAFLTAILALTATACRPAPAGDAVVPTAAADGATAIVATLPAPIAERGPTSPPEAGAAFVGGPNASFEGVTIAWADGLATGASVKAEPATTDGPDQAPPATVFRLDGYADEAAAFPASVAVYRLDGGGPDLADAVTVFKGILADQPPEPKVPMPATPASRVFMSQVRYLKGGGSGGAAAGGTPYRGVRFVTQLAQDVQPINNASLVYVFEGLTDDGTRWIQAMLPLDAHSDAVLPSVNVDDYGAFVERFDAYLAETTQAVGSLRAEDFSPSLTDLDALVEGIQIR